MTLASVPSGAKAPSHFVCLTDELKLVPFKVLAKQSISKMLYPTEPPSPPVGLVTAGEAVGLVFTAGVAVTAAVASTSTTPGEPPSPPTGFVLGVDLEGLVMIFLSSSAFERVEILWNER
jgi:hypothetical protein